MAEPDGKDSLKDQVAPVRLRLLEDAERLREERARKQQEAQRRREARMSLSACSQYGVADGLGVWIDTQAPESDLLQLERCGRNPHWPAGNEEFCRAWVAKCWRPCREKLLSVFPYEAVHVAKVSPPILDTREEQEHVRAVMEITRGLFLQYLQSQPEEVVLRELIAVRHKLGAARYQMAAYFDRLYSVVGVPPAPPDNAATHPAEAQPANLAAPNAPAQPPGPTMTWRMLEDVKVPTLEVTYKPGDGQAPIVVKIRGRTVAPLASLVMSQPDQDHTWRSLADQGHAKGLWIANRDSLEREGRQIRHKLPQPLRYKWSQNAHGVRWQS